MLLNFEIEKGIFGCKELGTTSYDGKKQKATVLKRYPRYDDQKLGTKSLYQVFVLTKCKSHFDVQY